MGFHDLAWRGIGHNVQECPIVEEALIQYDLDFDVKVVPGKFMHQGGLVDAKDFFYVVRTDRPKAIGQCKSSFTPVQNRDAFGFFQPFLDDGLCTLDTVGTFGDGQRVWIVARFTKVPYCVIGEDTVTQYLLLINGHDAETAISAGIITVRVQCSNQLPGLKKSMMSFKHTANVNETIGIFRNHIAKEIDKSQHYIEQLQLMAGHHMSVNDAIKYFLKVYDVRKEPKGKTLVKIEQLAELFVNGAGQELEGVGGTLYAAFNAVTEYQTHYAGLSPESRFRSNLSGTGVKVNDRALEGAMQLLF